MADALVVGANGFLGSHLVDALAGAGHRVRAFDRFSSAEPTFSSTDVEVVRGEFLSRTDIDSAVRGQDYVFHFLSTTSPATAEADPTLDIRTNVAPTVELLESCVSHGVEHVYFASTGGAIYGPQDKGEYQETDRAQPISPYGIGKLTIENYLRYFAVMHGLASTSLRISNPYGTRQHAHKRQGLIPIALRQIAHGQPVVRLGDGSMVRDYLYVEDMVRMIVALVGKDAQHDVYNIGSHQGHSVNDVLDSLRRVTGEPVQVVDRPAPATFVDRVVLDTGRYVREFGQVPLTPLDTGVAETWAEIVAQRESRESS